MPRTPLIYFYRIAKLVVRPSRTITWDVWSDVLPLLKAFALEYQGVELRFEVSETMGRRRRLVMGYFEREDGGSRLDLSGLS